MAEPLRKESLDFENEAPAPDEVTHVTSSLPGTPPALDESRGRAMESQDRATKTGEAVGSAVGNVVGNVKSSVRSGMKLFSDKSRDLGEKLSEATDSARVRGQEIADDAAQRTRELGRQARERISEAKRQTSRYAHEKPLHTIMGIAGAAFVVGLLLRIWRSNRD